MQQVRIKRFDPMTVKPGRNFLIVGKRGSGKTTLLRDLMYEMRDSFDFALAFCPTIESANMMRKHLPAACVYDRFVPCKIDQLVAVAEHLTRNGKQRRLLLICDDCCFDKQVMKGPAVRFIFLNGRHVGISFVILVQWLMDLGPDLRANLDYCLVQRDNIVSNRMRLWKYLFGCVGWDDFNLILDRCTQNFETLVLDGTQPNTTVQECIFWYKARLDLPAFKMCKAIFHQLSEQFRRSPSSTASTSLMASADGQLLDLAGPASGPNNGSGAPSSGTKTSRMRLQVIKEDPSSQSQDDGNDER